MLATGTNVPMTQQKGDVSAREGAAADCLAGVAPATHRLGAGSSIAGSRLLLIKAARPLQRASHSCSPGEA